MELMNLDFYQIIMFDVKSKFSTNIAWHMYIFLK